MGGKALSKGGGERTRYKGPGSGMPGGGPMHAGPSRGDFGRGRHVTAGKKIRKDRNQRYGKLVSEGDTIKDGKYIPWARDQAPGSVKEVTFNSESRVSYLTGFRKRKAERQTVAKKTISDKERNEIRKNRREKKSELMEKFNARVETMKTIADQASRLEKLKEAGRLQYDNDNSDSDNDSDNDSEDLDMREDEQLAIGPEKKIMTFGDARNGTATTVEIEEMDLSELQESAVSTCLPTSCSH